MGMDPEKRKRVDDYNETEPVTKKRSTKADEGEHVVREDEEEKEKEVEEFFAILRRIRVAVQYFEKADRPGRNLAATVKTWQPSFEMEDFEEGKGVRDDGELMSAAQTERSWQREAAQ